MALFWPSCCLSRVPLLVAVTRLATLRLAGGFEPRSHLPPGAHVGDMPKTCVPFFVYNATSSSHILLVSPVLTLVGGQTKDNENMG